MFEIACFVFFPVGIPLYHSHITEMERGTEVERSEG